jgi:hypothetical protein
MTSPTIQKEHAGYYATKVTKAIKQEMVGSLFSILIYESHDIFVKNKWSWLRDK